MHSASCLSSELLQPVQTFAPTALFDFESPLGMADASGQRRLRPVLAQSRRRPDPERLISVHRVQGELRILPELLRRLPEMRPLFEGLARETALEVEGALEWVELPAGDTLFEEGDAAPDVFVLTAGQLAVHVGSGAARRTVAWINPGEVVGEMALLAEAPRSASVVAKHASYLIRVPRKALATLMKDAPEARAFLLRVLTTRLRQTSYDPSPAAVAEKIAIVPLGAPDRVEETLNWLSRKVSPIVIGSAREEDKWGDRRTAAGRPIVYMADNNHSAWARRCIDQSDRVIFVADAGAGLAEVDTVAVGARLKREMNLVLVNRPDAALPSGASAWLAHFEPSQILHVRRGDQEDYKRVLRLITRSSVCVVFSGGGARALAHIGVVRALEERGIPIDAVAGTSMGALIAALVAQGVKAADIEARMRRYVVENNPIGEYTLPLVSLVRGRKLTRMFKEACDGAVVEDLWKTFFCVSADLATGKAVVHRSGPLWRALRASSAIPGVLPPVMGEGQVLVDGGIVDNMPTAAMRALNRGRVIGVDVSSDSVLAPCNIPIEQESWLRLLLRGRRQAPSMAQILMSSGTISSGPQRASARAASDILVEPALQGVGMLSFKALDQAVEAGYRAMQAGWAGGNGGVLNQKFDLTYDLRVGARIVGQSGQAKLAYRF